jgi:hypothetical protein
MSRNLISSKFQIEHNSDLDQTIFLLQNQLKNREQVLNSKDQVKMIVLDGVHYLGNSIRQWSEKKRKLLQLGQILRTAACAGITCLVVNSFGQVFSEKRNMNTFFHEDLNTSENVDFSSKPKNGKLISKSFKDYTWEKKFVSLGDSWNWVPQERFHLERIDGFGDSVKRVFQVWFSRSFCEKRLWFKIESTGLEFSEIQLENEYLETQNVEKFHEIEVIKDEYEVKPNYQNSFTETNSNFKEQNEMKRIKTSGEDENDFNKHSKNDLMDAFLGKTPNFSKWEG